MRRVYVAFVCLCLLGLSTASARTVSTAIAPDSKARTEPTKAGTARLGADIVALAPAPGAFQPMALSCPNTVCVSATHECILSPGSNLKCWGFSGGVCTQTVGCWDGLPTVEADK